MYLVYPIHVVRKSSPSVLLMRSIRGRYLVLVTCTRYHIYPDTSARKKATMRMMINMMEIIIDN